MTMESFRQSIFGLMVHFNRQSICYISGSERLPPPLTREEEIECTQRMLKGDESARRVLIERNLRLVVYIARRFESSIMSMDDLVSIGTVGLIKAVNSFDLSKNIKLATFASRCIENEILMVLRRTTRLKLEVSLEEPINIDIDGNELVVADTLGTDPDIVSRNIDKRTERSILYSAISGLPTREREIVSMRYGLMGNSERTQKEVADMLGISQSYISRIEKRILSKLKTEMLEIS